MRKVMMTAAAAAMTLTGAPVLAGGQYYGTYGSSQVGTNRDGYYAQNGYYRDRNGIMRDRYGNRVNEAAVGANVNADGFYVDSRGALRDRRGRIVTAARAERNGWYRDNRGYWVYGTAGYAQNGYYRDRNGVLRDRAGNRVTEQTAYANGNVWVGEDGRTYCRKRDGTIGTIVGGVAGALLGNAIGGTAGALIGGGAGALGGRAVERSSNDCR